MMAFYLLVFCIGLQVLCSYLYPNGRHDRDQPVLYWTSAMDPLRKPFLPALLLLVMVILFWIFR